MQQRMVLDPLALRLFQHHRALTVPALLARLLPMPHTPAPTITLKPEQKLERRRKLALLFGHDKIRQRTQKLTPQSNRLIGIMAEVCEKHNVTIEHLRCQWRAPPVVKMRNEFFYRACKETPYSYASIGRFCGRKDHTTVLYAVASYCKDHNLTHPRDSRYSPLYIDKKRARLKAWTETRSALRRKARAP